MAPFLLVLDENGIPLLKAADMSEALGFCLRYRQEAGDEEFRGLCIRPSRPVRWRLNSEAIAALAGISEPLPFPAGTPDAGLAAHGKAGNQARPGSQPGPGGQAAGDVTGLAAHRESGAHVAVGSEPGDGGPGIGGLTFRERGQARAE